IGSELCRQLAAHEPERLILYDRHENGVFVLEMELQARFPRVPLVPVLGTVLLEDQLRTVFAAHRPDLVFHAAAYKHLPMAERNVLETIRNNVIGTRNVAQAAIEHGAQEFVLVSTDKAVLPTSIMGATKRAAEMIVQELGNRGCRFVAVRFGNVLGSSGSVVPLFREQIASGPPTWPDIWLPRLQACVERGDVRAALKLLQTIIPAYRPSTLLLPAVSATVAAEVGGEAA